MNLNKCITIKSIKQMKTGNFLFNFIYEWNSQYPKITTNTSVCEIPDMVGHALSIFRTMDNNMTTLIKFKCMNYEIIIRQVYRITNKSIYRWKCTYKKIEK